MSSSQGTARDEPYAHHAWIDESITFGVVGRYVMAAVVADPNECARMRDALGAMRTGRRPRLHWHGESPERRKGIVTAISGFDVVCVAVVGEPLDAKRQERARGLCLKQLLHRLDELDVSNVLIERRTASLDRKDKDLVDGLRGAKVISKTMRVEVAEPDAEPMLWIPDAIAGALHAKLTGNSRWFDPIDQLVEHHSVQLA